MPSLEGARANARFAEAWLELARLAIRKGYHDTARVAAREACHYRRLSACHAALFLTCKREATAA